jgi:putative tricarboxylic transport membrane protein
MTNGGWRWRQAHQDVMVGAVLLVFCALAYWLTTGFDEVPAMLSQNVPPTFFPRLVLTFIALLSIVLIASGLRREAETKEKPRPVVLATAAVIAASPFAIAPLGTLPTLALLTAGLPLLWGERRYGRITALAVATPIAVYVLFTLALGVRFAHGAIEHLFG